MGSLKIIMERIKRSIKTSGLRYSIIKLFHKLEGWLQRKCLLPNYYADLENRIATYTKEFGADSKKTAVRLMWWNFKSLFKRHVDILYTAAPEEQHNSDQLEEERKRATEKVREKLQLSSKRLNVGFLIGGGFGDKLIFANYMYCFRERFKNIPLQMDVYFYDGFKVASSLFQEGGFCHRCYQFITEEPLDYYDIFILFKRYPEIIRKKPERIEMFAHQLLDYIGICEKFRRNYSKFFEWSPYCDGESAVLCELKGKKRIQQPDVGNMLGIGPEFAYPLFICGNDRKYLDHLYLQKGKFITLHRGSDVNYSDHVVKLWPLRYYNELIKSIKREYPTLKLVQLGVSHDRCPDMLGIDINLVGKTDMERVKMLLKNSLVHIDGEGGFTHLRRALNGGKSIVFFGATSREFFGYKGNENLKGNGCDHPCEWLTKDWLNHCPRGYIEPPCMTSITPAMAMNAFRGIVKYHLPIEIRGGRQCGIERI